MVVSVVVLSTVDVFPLYTINVGIAAVLIVIFAKPIEWDKSKVTSEASTRLIVAFATWRSEALKFAAVLWSVAGVKLLIPVAKKSEADVLADTARVEARVPSEACVPITAACVPVTASGAL